MLISHKLYLGFGTILATIGVSAVVSWTGTVATERELGDLRSETQQAKLATDVFSTVAENESNVLEFLVSNDETVAAKAREAQERARKHVAELAQAGAKVEAVQADLEILTDAFANITAVIRERNTKVADFRRRGTEALEKLRADNKPESQDRSRVAAIQLATMLWAVDRAVGRQGRPEDWATAERELSGAIESIGNSPNTTIRELTSVMSPMSELIGTLKGLAADRTRIFNETLDPATDRLLEASESLNEELAAAVTQGTDDIAAGVHSKLLVNTTMAIAALVVGASASLLISTSISRRISNLILELKQIQQTADLTRRVPSTGGDEIAQVATCANSFVEWLHQAMRGVAESTRQVAAASTQIAASSEQMSTGLKQQQGQTEQVSAAIAEMSASVVEVAKKSAEVATAAENSGKEARAGGEVVSQTVTEMKAIAEQVNESAASVAMLGKKSEQIGQIIGVINDIADQTNLLALNAAIEAARAGEHGRGFAVVADEVRKLAERTTQATKEVAVSIREIQGETTTAVERIEAGTSKVNTGVELAGNAGVALEKIVAGSTTLQSMVQSIAAAAEQQSAAGEQISRSVETINAVTRESTEGAEQSAKAAAQLSTQAEVLGKLVGKFKI
jgi:methyl-accepting chemotaxis protein